MRILFLLPDFPFPPSTGGRSKIFNELSYLSKQHKCDLLCFGSPDKKDLKHFSKVLPEVKVLEVVPQPTGVMTKIKALFNLLKLMPPSLAAFNDKNYSKLLVNYIKAGNYDVIHYDIINMAQYLNLGQNIPSVHSPNDATSLVYERLAKQTSWSMTKIRLWISAKLLKRYERRIYPNFTKIHVVTEIDAAYLRKLDLGIDTCAIPIALDIHQLNSSEARVEHSDKTSNGLRIICTGYLGNPAIADGTRDFIVNVLPEVLQILPDLKLVILGKDPDESLLELMISNDSIIYTEWVDDFKQFLLNADIILAPDYSGAPGAKTRVLQAMGLTLPVIGTRSAFEGIPIANGVHGVIYDSMDECTKLLKNLITNAKERTVIGKNGFELVAREFSLNAIGPRYEKMYLEAISSFR